MRDYDAYLGPEPVDETGPWSCPDATCTGHTRPGERCVEPDWDMLDDEDGVCP